jgi:hypothetical protein
MIDDLDRTLEELLHHELRASPFEEISISFATPDSEFPSDAIALPAVDLFLYDVQENTDLRDKSWTVEHNPNGTATRAHALTRINCSYLITAWPEDSATPAFAEHRLLGEIMKALVRHPTLPEAVLQGDLRNPDAPLPTGALHPGQLQTLTAVWQALGSRPRVALNYTATIAVAVERPVDTEALVIDKELRFDTIKRSKTRRR